MLAKQEEIHKFLSVGQMGEQMRNFDWGKTFLGEPHPGLKVYRRQLVHA
jgi:hypothetical protein